ncbi:MAG: ABC transporter ATP-binding protein [Saprospirales bacterium]|nr:ABC transporter ATP-binding protein [Saprospirales bacterium]
MRFPFFPQHDSSDCGAACLRMVAAWYGLHRPLSNWRELTQPDSSGVSLAGLEHAARSAGFECMLAELDFDEKNGEPGLRQAPLPCIVHWEGRHFVVVYRIGRHSVGIADPASGRHRLRTADFVERWKYGQAKGRVLLLQPGPAFTEGKEDHAGGGWRFMLQYLRPHRRLLVQVLMALLMAGVVQFLLPFLTQAVVDIGIQNRDPGFIWLILAGQFMLFGGQLLVRFLQDRIVLYIGTRINVNMLGDFLKRLLNQPIAFFESRMTGDLMQRTNDHHRIESFLTAGMVRILFSVFTLVVFAVVLALYSLQVFLVFAMASLLYSWWLLLFLRKRAAADRRQFAASAMNQNTLLEMFEGIREIKLEGSQQKHRLAWAAVQARLFDANLDALRIAQWQEAGAVFISQTKDLLITALVALAVIDGRLSFGMLLAVMFIIGQLNLPLQQLIAFVQAGQDARISLERLREIATTKNKEKPQGITEIPQGDLVLQDVSFRYSPLDEAVLKDVSLRIPSGKTTAIVGESGCGKTTLLKLLLRLYEPESGEITVGGVPLRQLDEAAWHRHCGSVLQDGYIFSGTIADNIAESEENPDSISAAKLKRAAHTACLDDFIEQLPKGFNAETGTRGERLSQGQRQRLLIARAVYKEPDYLFLDEPTNALDAHTESLILERLKNFIKNRTVVLVAHRLSTIRAADQILVMKDGRITESGTHNELMAKNGHYRELVEKQVFG